MNRKLLEIENAIIELGKVQVLLDSFANQAELVQREENATAKRIQEYLFIIDEMFRIKYKALKYAMYDNEIEA